MSPQRREARPLNEAPQTRRDPRPHRRAHPSVPGLQQPTSQDPGPPQPRGSLTAAQLPATAALSAPRVPMTHMAPPPPAGGGARMRTRIRWPSEGAPSTWRSGRNLGPGEGGSSGGWSRPPGRAVGEPFSLSGLAKCIYVKSVPPPL